MLDLLVVLNEIFWVVSNFLIAYVGVAILVFVVAYWVLFDPTATTAGRSVHEFALSVAAVVWAIVIRGVFIDPVAGPWYMVPPTVEWWSSGIRLLGIAYVTYTVTKLAVVLWFRRYRPGRLTIRPDETTLSVKPRPHK